MALEEVTWDLSHLLAVEEAAGDDEATVAALLDRARADGHEALSLSVDRHNEGAIALYEQVGFRRLAETPDSFTLQVTLA